MNPYVELRTRWHQNQSLGKMVVVEERGEIGCFGKNPFFLNKCAYKLKLYYRGDWLGVREHACEMKIQDTLHAIHPV